MRKIDWHRLLNDFMVVTGALLLLWAALVSVKPALASRQLGEENYLVSSLDVNLPLPHLSSIRNSETSADDVFFPLVYKPYTPAPTPTPTPTPTPIPSAGPVIRLVIPSIDVDRAVVPLKQYRDNSGQIQYNTSSLFANSNRLDLVGQVITSVNPGDGSNTVLVGHNYNRGWYAWEGVFVNLKNLKPGAKIVLYTEDGSKHRYYVTKVVQVPWVQKTTSELDKHLKYLGPTRDERVTLVTCGGPFGVWSARIYVIAK
ncbi:MAG: class F sortase [Anaerolineales bacterium]